MGYKSLNMGYNYSYPTYNSTSNYHEPPSSLIIDQRSPAPRALACAGFQPGEDHHSCRHDPLGCLAELAAFRRTGIDLRLESLEMFFASATMMSITVGGLSRTAPFYGRLPFAPFGLPFLSNTARYAFHPCQATTTAPGTCGLESEVPERMVESFGLCSVWEDLARLVVQTLRRSLVQSSELLYYLEREVCSIRAMVRAELAYRLTFIDVNDGQREGAAPRARSLSPYRVPDTETEPLVQDVWARRQLRSLRQGQNATAVDAPQPSRGSAGHPNPLQQAMHRHGKAGTLPERFGLWPLPLPAR